MSKRLAYAVIAAGLLVAPSSCMGGQIRTGSCPAGTHVETLWPSGFKCAKNLPPPAPQNPNPPQ